MQTYTNRKNQTYYLKIGTTKTGKPRYYASTNPDKGTNADAMPDGYEFRENVNGQVSVGKPQPSHIKDTEFAMIQAKIRKLKCDCRAEIKGKTIVLHTAEKNQFAALAEFLGPKAIEAMSANSALYQPMLRFVLSDKKERLFETERMFFSGEPDWMWIAPPQDLKSIVEKFIPLLDDEEALFEGDY
jgi:hypothetical protein